MSARNAALRVSIALLSMAAGLGTADAGAAASTSPPPRALTNSDSPSGSRELWATINVCGARNARHTVGIRGSMPPAGQSTDTMYMRFRLEYYNRSAHRWQQLGGNADSGFLRVGSASAVRQDGRSFKLAASSGAFTLRGLVNFEWLQGKRVVYAAERATSAGHKSFAGADPAGYSAATCVLG
jgi:hypothetical protein